MDQKSVAMKRDPSKGGLNQSNLDKKSLGAGSLKRRNTKELSKSPSGNLKQDLKSKASRKQLEEQDIQGEEFELNTKRTIKVIEFLKDKFMANNMGQDLPIEGGVKLTHPGGQGVSVGGDYKPVRK